MSAPAVHDSESVRVFCRIRPPDDFHIPNDQRDHLALTISDPSGTVVDVNVPNLAKDQSSSSKFRPKKLKFRYDRAFDHLSTQDNVFRETVPLIDAVLEGYHSTILAYGQSGSGKTYTMEGADWADTSSPSSSNNVAEKRPLNNSGNVTGGIIPRAIDHLFETIAKDPCESKRFLVRATYVEIYNEAVYDLLSANPFTHPLHVSERKEKDGFDVTGVSDVTVSNATELKKIFQRGRLLRRQAATVYNDRSSRSHAIFTVYVETSTTISSGNMKEGSLEEDDEILDSSQTDDEGGLTVIKVGKLNCVDLAGCERLTAPGPTPGGRLRETHTINSSLLVLSRCITALGVMQQQQQRNLALSATNEDSVDDQHTHYVPFRSSKLTMLLKDSLGGDSKTLVIATCRPEDKYFDSTQNTLRFASQLKLIKNRPKVHMDMREAKLRRLQQQLLIFQRLLEKGDVDALDNAIRQFQVELGGPMHPDHDNAIQMFGSELQASFLSDSNIHPEQKSDIEAVILKETHTEMQLDDLSGKKETIIEEAAKSFEFPPNKPKKRMPTTLFGMAMQVYSQKPRTSQTVYSVTPTRSVKSNSSVGSNKTVGTGGTPGNKQSKFRRSSTDEDNQDNQEQRNITTSLLKPKTDMPPLNVSIDSSQFADITPASKIDNNESNHSVFYTPRMLEVLTAPSPRAGSKAVAALLNFGEKAPQQKLAKDNLVDPDDQDLDYSQGNGELSLKPLKTTTLGSPYNYGNADMSISSDVDNWLSQVVDKARDGYLSNALDGSKGFDGLSPLQTSAKLTPLCSTPSIDGADVSLAAFADEVVCDEAELNESNGKSGLLFEDDKIEVPSFEAKILEENSEDIVNHMEIPLVNSDKAPYLLSSANATSKPHHESPSQRAAEVMRQVRAVASVILLPNAASAVSEQFIIETDNAKSHQEELQTNPLEPSSLLLDEEDEEASKLASEAAAAAIVVGMRTNSTSQQLRQISSPERRNSTLLLSPSKLQQQAENAKSDSLEKQEEPNLDNTLQNSVSHRPLPQWLQEAEERLQKLKETGFSKNNTPTRPHMPPLQNKSPLMRDMRRASLPNLLPSSPSSHKVSGTPSPLSAALLIQVEKAFAIARAAADAVSLAQKATLEVQTASDKLLSVVQQQHQNQQLHQQQQQQQLQQQQQQQELMLQKRDEAENATVQKSDAFILRPVNGQKDDNVLLETSLTNQDNFVGSEFQQVRLEIREESGEDLSELNDGCDIDSTKDESMKEQDMNPNQNSKYLSDLRDNAPDTSSDSDTQHMKSLRRRSLKDVDENKEDDEVLDASSDSDSDSDSGELPVENLNLHNGKSSLSVVSSDWGIPLLEDDDIEEDEDQDTSDSDSDDSSEQKGFIVTNPKIAPKVHNKDGSILLEPKVHVIGDSNNNNDLQRLNDDETPLHFTDETDDVDLTSLYASVGPRLHSAPCLEYKRRSKKSARKGTEAKTPVARKRESSRAAPEVVYIGADRFQTAGSKTLQSALTAKQKEADSLKSSSTQRLKLTRSYSGETRTFDDSNQRAVYGKKLQIRHLDGADIHGLHNANSSDGLSDDLSQGSSDTDDSDSQFGDETSDSEDVEVDHEEDLNDSLDDSEEMNVNDKVRRRNDTDNEPKRETNEDTVSILSIISEQPHSTDSALEELQKIIVNSAVKDQKWEKGASVTADERKLESIYNDPSFADLVLQLAERIKELQKKPNSVQSELNPTKKEKVLTEQATVINSSVKRVSEKLSKDEEVDLSEFENRSKETRPNEQKQASPISLDKRYNRNSDVSFGHSNSDKESDPDNDLALAATLRLNGLSGARAIEEVMRGKAKPHSKELNPEDRTGRPPVSWEAFGFENSDLSESNLNESELVEDDIEKERNQLPSQPIDDGEDNFLQSLLDNALKSTGPLNRKATANNESSNRFTGSNRNIEASPLSRTSSLNSLHLERREEKKSSNSSTATSSSSRTPLSHSPLTKRLNLPRVAQLNLPKSLYEQSPHTQHPALQSPGRISPQRIAANSQRSTPTMRNYSPRPHSSTSPGDVFERLANQAVERNRLLAERRDAIARAREMELMLEQERERQRAAAVAKTIAAERAMRQVQLHDGYTHRLEAAQTISEVERIRATELPRAAIIDSPQKVYSSPHRESEHKRGDKSPKISYSSLAYNDKTRFDQSRED